MNDITSLKYLPQDLKFSALWCCWKLTNKGKTPFTPTTGQLAKSNDPTTFVSYPVLLQHVHKYLKEDENGKQIGGIGLGVFRGFSAIDIDHCVDENGKLSDTAEDIINYCNSYTEYSPSKTGIRIIFKTDSVINKDEYYINNHNIGLEIYISDNTSKFVSITGFKMSNSVDSINTINIDYLLEKYMKKDKFNLDKILSKDKKLNDLWNSVAPGSHSNESEIDMALCCKLAYYLKNDEIEIEKYFRMSPFYKSKDEMHKKKWDNREYVKRTLRGATTLVEPAINNLAVDNKHKFELNDTGNARRFISQFGDILHYNIDNNIWMIWNDKFWEYDIKNRVKSYAEIMAEQMLFESNTENDLNMRSRILKNIDHIYASGGKEALLKEARHIDDVPVMNSDFDQEEYLLCTNNGTINLKTGELQESSKTDMISMCTGCDADLENEPVLFNKFLKDMFPENPEIIHYLQKAFGYSITNSAREQCMFILHGDGNNGKSLLLDIIKCALGSYGITSKPQLLTEQKYSSGSSEEIARLKGKRFVAIEEIKMNDRLDEQLVKSLTSGIGNQVARFLYGNSFEFPFKGKLWMATNYEPVITGTDKGIWRRIKKIPVKVDFTGREDRDLRTKLLNELPQILGWILKGYLMYEKEGLIAPESILIATKEYREEMDIVQQWINDNCEIKNDYFERANILYDNFKMFCQRRDQRTNQTAFGRNLGKKFTKVHSSSGILYLGIRLKRESEDITKKEIFDAITVNKDI